MQWRSLVMRFFNWLGTTVLAAAICIGVVILYVKVRRSFDWPASHTPSFLAGAVLGLVVHELGHALAALAYTWPIRRFVIGTGPCLWRSQGSRTSLELRLLPLSGFVQPYPALHMRRGQTPMLQLGGVLANLALAALLLGFYWQSEADGLAHTVMYSIAQAQILIALVNMLPFTVSVDGERVGSDGMQFIGWLFEPKAHGPTPLGLVYRQHVAGNATGARDEVLPTAAAHRIAYHSLWPNAQQAPTARQDRNRAFASEIARGELSAVEELYALDALVTSTLIHRDQELVRHLDIWSARALALAPDLVTIQGSRGAALIELGQVEEGHAMLAAIAGDSTGFDAFMTKLFLAKAELARGNLTAAQNWANAAREEAQDRLETPAVAVLLPRLESELAAATSGLVSA